MRKVFLAAVAVLGFCAVATVNASAAPPGGFPHERAAPDHGRVKNVDYYYKHHHYHHRHWDHGHWRYWD